MLEDRTAYQYVGNNDQLFKKYNITRPRVQFTALGATLYVREWEPLNLDSIEAMVEQAMEFSEKYIDTSIEYGDADLGDDGSVLLLGLREATPDELDLYMELDLIEKARRKKSKEIALERARNLLREAGELP